MDSPIGGCNAGLEPTSGRTVGHRDDTVAVAAGDLGLSRGRSAPVTSQDGNHPASPNVDTVALALLDSSIDQLFIARLAPS
jgi:hypothetical protein